MNDPKKIHTIGSDWVTSMCFVGATCDLIYSARDGTIGFITLDNTEFTFKSELVLPGHKQRATQISLQIGAETWAVSGGWDKSIIVWDLKEKKKVNEIKNAHKDDVMGVALSPHQNEIWSCGRDGAVNVFDLETGKQIHSFTSHNKAVVCIECNPNPLHQVVSVGADDIIKVWDCRSKREAFSWNPTEVIGTRTMEISPDGSIVEVGGSEAIQLWDFAENKPLYLLPTDEDLSSYDINFSPTHYWSLSASSKGLRIWDLEQKNIISNFPCSPKQTPVAMVWDQSLHLYIAYSDNSLSVSSVNS